MGKQVPDYKKDDGSWAKSTKIAGCSCMTVSGSKWYGMLRRCSDKGYHRTHPSYVGTTHTFENYDSFVEWHINQTGYGRGWHLDKDLLLKDNTVYSADICLLIPQEINSLINRHKSTRGDLPIGVTLHESGKFIASIGTNGIAGIYLGISESVVGAFNMYKEAKESYIKQQAEKWKDQIDPRAYEALMNYEVLITD